MKNKFLFFLIFMVVSIFSYGQSYQEFIKETYSWNAEYQLPYRIFKPKDESKKYPLVIFLHGIGERGSDNQKQLDNNGVGSFLTKLKNSYPAIIVAPQCPYSSNTADKSYWTNAITETSQGLQFDLTKSEPTIPMKMLMSLITELIDSGQVDENQVYLGGISMGAFGVYELLWRMPNVFKAAFPICGASTVDKAKLETYVGKTRIWTFHGSLDNIVPFGLGNDTYNTIQQIPTSKIKYTVYDGVYHNSWDYAFNEQKLIPWVFGYNDLEKGYYKINATDSLNSVLTNNIGHCATSTFAGKNNQQWLIYDGEKAGTYRILAADGSNLYFTSSGENINLNYYVNNDSQLWKILETDGSYYITSVQNSKTLSFDNSELKLSDKKQYKWNISLSKLFIVGNAINSGWNTNNANEMTLQPEQNGIFKWTGVIYANGSEFKFLTTKNTDWIPTVNAAYNNGDIKASDKEYKLAVNTDYKNDYKFRMKDAGIYEVTVDMVNKKMSIKKNYEEVYLVGEVSLNGWDYYNGIKLKKKDRNILEWSGYLKAGAFKFLTQKGTWYNSLTSYIDNQAISENDSSQVYPIKFNTNLDTNFNYKIRNSGFYKIKIDLNNETLSVYKKDIDKISMTGSALQNDTIEIDRNQLYSGNKYKYTGTLNSGTIQFIVEDPFTSDSLFINPNSGINNLSVVGSTSINFSQQNNWVVPLNSDNYRLTIDLDQLLLKGEIFIPRSTNYYLVGGASAALWDIYKAIPFVQDPNNLNIYTLNTTLTPKQITNGNQFKILQQKSWWGYSFHPNTYNKAFDGIDTYEEQYGYGGSNDYKWTIDDDHAGNYLITLNLLDQTIKFEPELMTRNTSFEQEIADISILVENNNILIENKSDKNVDVATLVEIGTGRILSKEINKLGNFYLAEDIPTGVYAVNVLQGNSVLTKKIIIK